MDQSVAVSIRHFVSAWDRMCEGIPGTVTASSDGAQLVFSGLPIPFFNIVFLTGDVESGEDLCKRAEWATAQASVHGVPWFLVATQEALAGGLDAEALLDEAGFAPVMNLTGMVADTVPPAGPTPEGLDMSEPVDDASSLAMLTINSAAYGMELSAGEDTIGSHAFWKEHVSVVGSVEGTPAACAGVVEVEGHRYVLFVATLPDCQRRGYASAVMRRALEIAGERMGQLPSTLHATDAGKPVYERMGYRVIARHPVFMEKRFLEH